MDFSLLSQALEDFFQCLENGVKGPFSFSSSYYDEEIAKQWEALE